MKVSELMIGDWVRVPSECNRYKQIKSTFDLDEAVLYEPILLTEEILEKNGFESYSHILWGIKTAEGHWVLAYMDYYWSFTMDCTIYKRIKIQYVHELQHALKLCGIKKEITL